MTEMIDQLIQARFDGVARADDDGSWADVLARARRAEPARRRRRAPLRLALVGAVTLIAATVTAVAFGWPRIVDFFKAPPAPQSVQQFFRGHDVAVPGGVDPEAGLGQAREVMTASFDVNNIPPEQPTLHTLYVAPRTDGGFCFLWTGYGGGCADPEDAAAGKTDPAARPIGVSWLANDYAGFVDGWVRPDAQTVEAGFADGTTAAIPVTWVSAPIDAGFFAYVVPPAHQSPDDAVTSIAAFDANGDVVGLRQPIPVTKPIDQDVLQTLPDGRKISLPRRAQASRAREIARGAGFYLWVMPRTGGGNCFLYSTGGGGGGGCTSPRWIASSPAVFGNVVGERRTFYLAQVKRSIATIELRYADGTVRRVEPADGFVFQAIPPGTRLARVLGLGRNGQTVFERRLRQQGPG